MKIEANDKEIQDIFSLGYFKIPRFQRPYSWGLDEVSSFWSDIIQQNNDSYFIGSMVVYQEKKPYFGIVDGQQRLTTITLIFAAIRNAFILLNEENLAKGIHLYIERPNINNEEEFILNSETSFPYFHNHIQSYNGLKVQSSVGSEEQNLKSAFEYITSSLYDLLPQEISNSSYQSSIFQEDRSITLQKLKDIRDKILSLKLVFIQLDNEEDAYLIFETLNARGRDLTTSDLVKNHLLKKLKSTNLQNDSAKLIWNGILKRFDDAGFQNGIDSFLYHFWLSGKKYTTDKNLFSDLKNQANTADNAKSLLVELQTDSNHYLSIISPNSYDWTPEESRIKQIFESLIYFNVKQQLPMVLSLIRAYRSKKITLRMLIQVLEKIEFFHFVFNSITSQRSSGSIQSHYSKYAIQLTEAESHSQIQTTLSQLISGLKTRLPTYNEFEANFIELSYTSKKTKNKSIIRYALRKLLGDNSGGLSIDYNSMSIEHLLPEDKITSEDDEIGNIGNLILIDKKTNSEVLSNLSFSDKKSILIGINYPLDDIIINSNEWNSDKIKDRAKHLAQQLYVVSILG
jgi:uncharacterized protein with ParB-like and HNH nuclease domain